MNLLVILGEGQELKTDQLQTLSSLTEATVLKSQLPEEGIAVYECGVIPEDVFNWADKGLVVGSCLTADRAGLENLPITGDIVNDIAEYYISYTEGNAPVDEGVV